MQGIIASLLALMMTGMVFSQQPQSNNFQSRQIDNAKLLGRYLLIVDQNVVQTLKTHGFRSANIQESDRQNVDHIVFHATEFNASADLEPFSIQPVPPIDGDDTLVFELDDHYLDLLSRKGLRYILRPQDIGRFKVLTIKYESPSQPISGTLPVVRPAQQQLTPRSNGSQLASDRNVNQLAPQVVRNATDEYGAPFYGPSLPDDWQRSPVSQAAADTGTFRPRLGSIATRREPSTRLQPQRDHYSNDLQPDRNINVLPTIRNDDQLAYRNQQNRTAFDNRVASNTPFDSQAFRSGTQPQRMDRLDNASLQPVKTTDYDPVLRDELRVRNAENRSLDQMNQTLADQNESLRRQLQEERLANRRDRLAVRTDPRASAYDRDYDYDTGYRNREFDNQVIVQPPINTAQSMPDRVAVTPKPSSRLLPFAIEGPAGESEPQNGTGNAKTVDARIVADAERYRKQNAALWFIMLCSVGLNFYLSWIARGFYVRYEELADDIRETFTSSM